MAGNEVRVWLERQEAFDRDVLGASHEGFCAWLSNKSIANMTPQSTEFLLYKFKFWLKYTDELLQERRKGIKIAV